jgi:putative membrane protein
MRRLYLGLTVAFGLFCGVALAQNAQRENEAAQPGAAGQRQAGQQPGQAGQNFQTRQPGVPRQAGQFGAAGQQATGQQATGQQGSSDQQIAACVYGKCHNEIELSKLAESKAQSEEVKNFAQRMVKDHTPGCQKMQQMAGQLINDQGHAGQNGQAGAEGAPRVATTERAGATSQAHGGQLDWVGIHNQIAQQCLTSTKQELSSKSSAEFDKCYMGQQIAAHMEVIDALKVLRNYASQQLQQDLDKELQTAQTHLQLAKQIEQQLKDRPSERVSRRPKSE